MVCRGRLPSANIGYMHEFNCGTYGSMLTGMRHKMAALIPAQEQPNPSNGTCASEPNEAEQQKEGMSPDQSP